MLVLAVSRSAMASGLETNDVTNDQGPERRCEQGAQAAVLSAGHNAGIPTLACRLPVESASSGRDDARAGNVGRPPINTISDMLELDMTKDWTPTRMRYLSDVSKARIQQLVVLIRGKTMND
jgi:hypothetical protein